MRKVLMIARREYIEAVRKKAFWIGMLLFPLLMGAMFVVPIGLSQVNPERQKTLVIVDETGRLAGTVAERLAEETLADGTPEYVVESIEATRPADEIRRELEPRILEGKLYGVVTIGSDFDASDGFRFYRKNVGDLQTSSTVRSALHSAVIDLRLERSDLELDKGTLEALTAGVNLESFQVTAGQEAMKKGFIETYLATYLFVIMLYFMLYFYGYSVTRGVLQEKSSRVMEVLLGSVSPDQLMTGKILGIGLVGLTQTGFYIVTVGSLRLVAILFFVGKESGFDAAALVDAVGPAKLVFFVVYYVLGYFMFVTLFAIIGAVCNSEQEAQNFQLPVVLSLLIPMISTIFFVQHPDAPAAVVLSLVPLFTPMLMFMRISVLSPPAWQIALSIVLLLVTIWVLFKAAAKIFRIGTLMYGKRPTIPEILRWARG